MGMETGSASFLRYSTSFIGRERESTELAKQISHNRFVGVTGPGGVGKTRLVAHLAPRLREKFEVLIAVDLVGVVTRSQFLVQVADAAGVRDADAATLGVLVDALQDREVLLLLDGCELLDGDCQLTVQDLLEGVASLSILATSRRAVHVDGGVVVALPPLNIPPTEFELPEAGMSAEEVAPYEAVELFIERARLVRPDFRLTSENALSVATLCRRLDGLPLALELGASWIRALSAGQIIDRMEKSVDFPRAGTRNVAPRHRTLSSMVAATFDLCSPEEQVLWARMTVFRESFDLTAVEAVCGGSPLHDTDLLDTIAALVDQSVVVVDDISGHSRYRLLRITREYGAGKLDNPDEVRARHRDHFDRLMSEHVQRWPGPGQIRLLSQVRADYANIIAAIDWGLQQPDTVTASVRTAADLWCFWFATGRLTEGRSVLGRAASSPLLDATAVERVRALYFNAYLSVLQGEIRSARKLHDIASASHPEPASDLLCRGLHLQLDAMIRMGVGDDIDPVASLNQAIETFAQGEDSRAVVMFMDAIGVSVLLAALRGNSKYATELGSRGLATCDEHEDVLWRAYIEYSLGVDAWVQQSFNEARTRALAGLRASPDQLVVTHCIELLAWCASSQADFVLAARLFGAADRRWRQLGGYFSGFRGISENRDRCLAATRRGQTAEDFAAAYGSGEQLTVDAIAADTTKQGVGSAPAVRPGAADSPLTNREHEVALLVAQGLSNREIAEKLTISPRTAESHVDHILTKLDLPNRTQVVAWMLSWQRSGRTDTDVTANTVR